MFGTPRPSREAVYGALFGLLEGITFDVNPSGPPNILHFKERTRKIVLFSDVPAKEQPWIGQAEHNENSTQVTNLPYKRTWAASWMVYHQASAIPKQIGTIWNNQIIDALEAALAPKPTDPGFLENRNTLSGLVHHCFIEGEIFKDPGDIDKQALIVVPIKLLVP